MNATAKTSKEKISEALKLLDEAAHEGKDELKEMMVGKFGNLKDAVIAEEERVKRALSSAGRKVAAGAIQLKDVSAEKTKEVAVAVNESAHKNPWPYIAGAAIGGLALGYLMGHRQD